LTKVLSVLHHLFDCMAAVDENQVTVPYQVTHA